MPDENADEEEKALAAKVKDKGRYSGEEMFKIIEDYKFSNLGGLDKLLPELSEAITISLEYTSSLMQIGIKRINKCFLITVLGAHM